MSDQYDKEKVDWAREEIVQFRKVKGEEFL
jgi:hypothetical protein